MQRYDRLLLLLPGWLGFMLYLPALSHGFVWDDTYFLNDLPYLRDPDLWLRQISEPLFVSRNYFRPLPLLSFVVEARLGGLDPFFFHLANLLLHAANTTLIVLLARRVVPTAAVAATIAGVLYAIHPALVEGVAWISDRFDLMMVFFVLLALVCEQHLRRTGARAAVVAICFVLALLCKESAVVLLVLLPLWQALNQATDGNWRPWESAAWGRGDKVVWLAVLLGLFCYLALRHAVLGFLYLSDAPMDVGNGLQHILLIGKTFGWYLVLALWPFGQVLPVHPGQTPVAPGDLWAWLGLAAGVATCSLLAYLVATRPQARRPALAGFMVLVALSPVANLVPLTIGDNILHDRFLMLPLACLALLLAMLWNARNRRFFAVATGAWGMAAVVTVWGILPHWESNLSLWRWAYTHSPKSQIASQNYVAALVNANLNEATVAVVRPMIDGGSQVPNMVHNLALALSRLGQYEEAERLAHRAIALIEARDDKDGVTAGNWRLGMSESYNLLGIIYFDQGRHDEAGKALRQSVALVPYLSRPHYNLAMLHYELGNWAEGDAEIAFSIRYGSPELAEVRRIAGEDKKRKMRTALGLPKEVP